MLYIYMLYIHIYMNTYICCTYIACSQSQGRQVLDWHCLGMFSNADTVVNKCTPACARMLAGINMAYITHIQTNTLRCACTCTPDCTQKTYTPARALAMCR